MSRLIRLVLVSLLVAGVFATVEHVRRPGSSQQSAAAAPNVASIAELEDRTRDRPDDAGSWLQLGQAYTQRTIETGDADSADRAARAFDRTDQLSGDGSTTSSGRAALAATLHRFEEARSLAQAALSANPYDEQALAALVDSDVELGRYDDAERDLQTFIDRQPGAAALSRTSYLRQIHGDLDGALEAIRAAEVAAARSQPASRATVLAIRAEVLADMGRRADARQAFEQALELSPDLLPAVLGLAELDAISGRPTEAIEALEAFGAERAEPGVAVLRSDIHRLDGDETAAREAADLAAELFDTEQAGGHPAEPIRTLFRAAHGVPSAGTVAEARTDHERRPSVYFADALAWTLFRAGDVAAAVAPMNEALRLGTADPVMRFHAAAIFEAAGDRNRAIVELRIARDREPMVSPAHAEAAAELARRLGLDRS